MSSPRPFRLPFRRSTARQPASTEPPLDPSSWSGALIVILAFAAVLWVIQIFNARHGYSFNRFGLKPRQVDGLWGVLTQPFLHESYGHLLSNTVPVVGVGWVLMLSGIRVWAFVTVVVIVLGGLATWLVGPSDAVIVGASGLVFGWMGYLLARAYFSRRLKWIFTAAAVLVFFGTLLGSLLPTVNARISWQSHICGFLAGAFVGWFLHPRKGSPRTSARRTPVG